MSQAEKREVRTTAEKVSRRKQTTRLLLIILLIAVLLMGISFALAKYANQVGRFTVNLDEDALTKRGISISESKDFSDPKIFLQAAPYDDMSHFTKDWFLDDERYSSFEDIDKIDGAHNGQDNIAYTFYIKNGGREDAGYNAQINIDSATLGADHAIRVMLFVNGAPTVYAKPVKGTTNELEPFAADKNFFSDDIVAKVSNEDFKAGNIDKYTVVIWLEGEDPECVNDILGGEVKLSMNFRLIDEEAV